MLLFNEKGCCDLYIKNKSKYVALAAEDLIKDFRAVSACGLAPAIADKETDNCIIIEENDPKCGDAPIESEGFEIVVEGGKARIKADGYFGTLWGIYTFSEKFLGVSPCYLFDDKETEKKSVIEIADIRISDRPESFGFRGIFVNDEDYLTGCKNGGERHIDYRFYKTVISGDIAEMIVETALRLKFNLIIPSSFVDIANPPEKKLIDIAARRGIYVSQHHIEPLGLSHFAFENYCRAKGGSQKFSYTDNGERVREAWRDYAEKWAEYDRVVWQIGLRGKADRPVWEEDDPSESELAEYGKTISSALSEQIDTVRKATRGKAKYFTSTLWMEGSKLVQRGYLDSDKDVIWVFSDNGPNQMFGADYYSVDRKEDKKYGVYYHLAYWGCGPHSAPQTGIDKIYHSIKLANDRGDNSYVIFNVANIREFVFELKACSEMVWDTDGFDKEKYLDGYCGQFGENSLGMKRAITEYYNSLPEIDVSYLKYHLSEYFNYNYGERADGVKNFVVKEGMLIVNYGAVLVDKEFLTGKTSFMQDALYKAVKAAIPAYRRCFDEFSAIADRSEERLGKHIRIKWALASKTLLAIYEWYTLVYEGVAKYAKGDKDSAVNFVKKAIGKLKEYTEYRKIAEYGLFENWYKADDKIDVNSRIVLTENLLKKLTA